MSQTSSESHVQQQSDESRQKAEVYDIYKDLVSSGAYDENQFQTL
jgi:hypothetical protein